MQVQDDPGRSSDLDLRHYLRVIGRRRWVILGLALLVGLAAMGWATTKTPLYRASADLLLLAPGPTEAAAESLSDEPERAIANEIEILGSLEMREAVAERLGTAAPDVDASTSGDSDAIVITSSNAVPEDAAEAVNAYARAYQQLRRQRTVDALRVQLQGLQQDRERMFEDLAEIGQPLEQLDTEIAATPPGPQLDALVAERAAAEQAIQGVREGTNSRITAINTQIQEVQQAMQSPTGGVRLLNPATVPSERYYPQPKKDLLVGLIVGLLLGLAVAFVWEQLDDRIRSRADADRATGGLPLLGLVPRVGDWKDAGRSLLVTRDEPQSGAAESYRSLVTSLEFLAAAGQVRTILLTSPGASEGKTTTAANVGLAFAEAGHRTVIVDADLRRPRLHTYFGVDNTVGLSTVLAGKIDVATAVLAVSDERPVAIVAAGPIAPNPAELLRSEATEAALTKLADSHDVVIIDSPPVLPVSDALVLSRHADVAVLVAAADNTSSRSLSRAVEALRQVDAPLRGVVLNGVGTGEGYEYGYYGEADGEVTSNRRSRSRWRRRRARR